MSIATLKNFGLTNNEAKIYLAALELGQATVQELGKKAKIKRTTVYTTLEGLKQKGLISQTKKGKKTLFIAENPENLVIASEKRYKELKKALPELKSIYNLSPTKPKLRFLEGKQGFLSVYENILKEKPKEFLAIASYTDFANHIDEEYETKWTEQRIKKNIKLRWLDFETKHTKKLQKKGKKTLREIRFLPKEHPFTSTMFLYNDKVIIMSGKQKEFMAIVIENNEFYQMYKQLFEILWLSHKPTKV